MKCNLLANIERSHGIKQIRVIGKCSKPHYQRSRFNLNEVIINGYLKSVSFKLYLSIRSLIISLKSMCLSLYKTNIYSNINIFDTF